MLGQAADVFQEVCPLCLVELPVLVLIEVQKDCSDVAHESVRRTCATNVRVVNEDEFNFLDRRLRQAQHSHIGLAHTLHSDKLVAKRHAQRVEQVGRFNFEQRTGYQLSFFAGAARENQRLDTVLCV